ncbi:hypothetical protein J6590_023419 [Homalodisca vitripennis]|nr:hypothetical protein J6590_023419 [Homalodisca vitripennis]
MKSTRDGNSVCASINGKFYKKPLSEGRPVVEISYLRGVRGWRGVEQRQDPLITNGSLPAAMRQGEETWLMHIISFTQMLNYADPPSRFPLLGVASAVRTRRQEPRLASRDLTAPPCC